MRIRFATLTAITLLTATTLLTGCSKETSNSTNVNASNSGASTSASPAATSTQPSSTATPMTSASGATTPTGAFTAYYEAIKRKDTSAVKSLFSKGTLSMMEEQAKIKNTTLDAVMKEGLEGASKDIPNEVPETRNEKIDGDKATLEIRDAKKDAWDTVHFVREDGQWKMAFEEKP